jgi:Glu-tRNA(Gln) amidotransferase subunit E-like FAD-binding protein
MSALRDRLITREGLLPVLVAEAMGRSFSRDALPSMCPDRELTEIIDRCTAVLSTHPPRDPEQSKTVLMGKVMNQVRGRTEGRVVAQRIGLVTPEEHHD